MHPWSAPVLLALLLGVGEAHAAAGNNDTYCERLARNGSKAVEESMRIVWVKGVATNVTLVWGSEPARAASALLRVLLRYVRKYDGVHLSPRPYRNTTATLAAALKHDLNGSCDHNGLVISVSTAWEPVIRTGAGPAREGLWSQHDCPLDRQHGWHLTEFGASAVPARCRLLAWLAPHARTRPACQGHVRWAFYANRTALADCDFVDVATLRGPTVDVLAVGDCANTLLRLQERASATNTSFKPLLVDRTSFTRTLHNANHSFLFLDFDMWKGVAGISAVEPPPCVCVDCKQELDSTVAVRVGEVDNLFMYVPQFMDFVHDFHPSPESLRWILARQTSGVDIEEAACEWAWESKHYDINDQKYDKRAYTVSTFLCSNGNDNIRRQYDAIIRAVGIPLYESFRNIFDLSFRRYFVNCSDEYHMNNRLNQLSQSTDVYKWIGVVSMSVKGAAAASVAAAAMHMPLMLADVVPEEGMAMGTTWRAGGRPRHIALALRHFVIESGWKRVAVLSQNSKLAHDYYTALDDIRDKATIVLHEFPISLHLKEKDTKTVLQELRNKNARIVLVNADSRTAHTILNEAANARMGYSDGYVWIVREWLPDEPVQSKVVCGTNHFTVSFCSRGMNNLPLANGWPPLRDYLNRSEKLGHPWPPRAVSLADALISLSIGFKNVFERYPKSRDNMRSIEMIRLLEESLIERPVPGVGQRLHYAEHSIKEMFVFVDQWCGEHFHRRLATWHVDASNNGTVRDNCSGYGNYSRPHDLPSDDGTSRCIVRSGDAFTPTCYDVHCVCTLLLLILALSAVHPVRRVLRHRLTRIRQEQQIQNIARRRHVATALSTYLVKRAALELCEELGAGRFGSVSRARLYEPGRALRYVAAKALRDNAASTEESEFLREACTIASLKHAHIVRLVGVCIADGPPLVLMELAFFGDLLGYLRERRHLVEGTGSGEPAVTGEMKHVSAEALTRLAREAAEALEYLRVRGVVHRDVRAANCLVDVQRSLKLADFGMARDTVLGADGALEYACRRRGLFPVLWMAPESLAHGVFSTASDVWALGVLVLELVTLGVRPYGSMSPLRVLEYVTAGGSPPLPLDASPQTCGLVRLCWAREAERRPSAAEVAAYLAARPRALCPALLSEPHEPPSCCRAPLLRTHSISSDTH